LPSHWVTIHHKNYDLHRDFLHYGEQAFNFIIFKKIFFRNELFRNNKRHKKAIENWCRVQENILLKRIPSDYLYNVVTPDQKQTIPFKISQLKAAGKFVEACRMERSYHFGPYSINACASVFYAQNSKKTYAFGTFKE